MTDQDYQLAAGISRYKDDSILEHTKAPACWLAFIEVLSL
jgi:hypothetical protein